MSCAIKGYSSKSYRNDGKEKRVVSTGRIIIPLYFAYGSNLDLSQFKKRCPEAKPLMVGCLKGYRLAFTHRSSGWGCGVADVVSDSRHEVWGLIYALSDRDLEELDNFEGYPDVYTRFSSSIDTKEGTICNVWVYTVIHKSNFIPPSKAYLGIIKKAAEKLGFPEAYRAYLEKIEIESERLKQKPILKNERS